VCQAKCRKQKASPCQGAEYRPSVKSSFSGTEATIIEIQSGIFRRVSCQMRPSDASNKKPRYFVLIFYACTMDRHGKIKNIATGSRPSGVDLHRKYPIWLPLRVSMHSLFALNQCALSRCVAASKIYLFNCLEQDQVDIQRPQSPRPHCRLRSQSWRRSPSRGCSRRRKYRIRRKC